MSLSKLSAEFDAHVCRCFVGDTSALSAFSKQFDMPRKSAPMIWAHSF
ncbi:hypothetical protein SNOG_00268 [Parastagonospora nodorum SN15]|uniref:Uncharacterized protein n=1 Tax=Phaeosphaeria nodorum (strain SN15 / ATCC MYA-4574 / FGSC 10173) TaxID=321614 RepID=Q0V6U6_PHANO|nr:hypothetical protein SNOG_00268 [Parastagonospora nodorum SN15]EAT91763.1 hypothetical protein SNOG_00268 [Parastagonospora nodorum SN15]